MITTIVLTVSRNDFLPEVLSSLELLDCDSSYTNILCIVDGDQNLYVKVRNLIQTMKFNERRTIQYPDRKPIKRYDPIFRRKRITAIHNFAKEQIGIADFVFLTEDDTIVPRDTLTKLTRILNSDTGSGFAEGVEVGRWGIPYVGVWNFGDIYNPTSVTSHAFKNEGVDATDAGGFYCTLIKADLYKNHIFNLYESLGPDISMGLKLRQEGYSNYVDWSIACKHLNMKSGEREVLIPDDSVKPTTIKRMNENNWSIQY